MSMKLMVNMNSFIKGTSYPIAPLCTFADLEVYDPSIGNGLPPNT